MDRACIEAAVTEAILGRRRVRVTLHPRTLAVSGLSSSDLPLEGYPTRIVGDAFGLISESGRMDYTLDEPSQWDPAVVAVEVLP